MGCVVSTALAVLVCKNKCDIDKLISSMAFHPPSPPSYKAEENAEGTVELTFASPEIQQVHSAMRLRGLTIQVRLLRTSRKETIPLFHYTVPGATTTLLWSHSNAMDCGEMYFFFAEVAARLHVNIAAYDYSGYGAATGRPSEKNINADALAVYEHLVASAGLVPQAQIVLYGQSIGSAPTLWLATKRPVAGVILHTPLLSGLRFMLPPSKGFCSPGGPCCGPLQTFALCDPFPNIKRIKKLKCPVLMMHGTADEIIDVSHTWRLHALLPKANPRLFEPYIVQGAGHDNIVDADLDGYFAHLADFLRAVPAAAGPATPGSAAAASGRGNGPQSVPKGSSDTVRDWPAIPPVAEPQSSVLVEPEQPREDRA